MPVMSAFDSSRPEYCGPIASRMSVLPFRAREGGAESVRDFVEDHEIESAFAGDHLRLIRGHQALGQRQDDVVHARVHEILPEDFLRALFLVDARIVRADCRRRPDSRAADRPRDRSRPPLPSAIACRASKADRRARAEAIPANRARTSETRRAFCFRRRCES